MKKAKLDFNASKAVEDILEQFKKTIPSWSAFISLLISIAVVGAWVLLGIICLPILFKLNINTQWKVGLELHGVKLCTLP